MSIGTVFLGSSAVLPAARSSGGGETVEATLLADARARPGTGPDAAQRLYVRTVETLQRIADGLSRSGAAGAAPKIERMVDRPDLARVARMDTVLQEYKQRFPNGATGLVDGTRQANDEAFRLKVELVGASIEFQQSMNHLVGLESPTHRAAAVKRVESAASRLLDVRQGIDVFNESLLKAIRSAVPAGYL
jgi:hypothetical protein